MNKELVDTINKDMELQVPANSNGDQLLTELSEYITILIQKDFQKLVNILYRLDVSETRIKEMLEQNIADDAGLIIAGLIIERQIQKIKSRAEFRQSGEDISEEERW